MTALRQEAISMVNSLPEDYLSSLIQSIKDFMEKNSASIGLQQEHRPSWWRSFVLSVLMYENLRTVVSLS